MSVDTLTVCFVIDPISIVDITVRMNKSTAAVGFAILPPAFVHGTVRPNLLASAFSDVGANDPLTNELGLVLKILHRSLLEILTLALGSIRLIAQVVEITELLVNFLKYCYVS
jgi:hypothetical protein